MNELYIEKLLRLLKHGVIVVDDIKDENYKIEVQNRLSSQ